MVRSLLASYGESHGAKHARELRLSIRKYHRIRAAALACTSVIQNEASLVKIARPFPNLSAPSTKPSRRGYVK